jgi:PKD repeat protein
VLDKVAPQLTIESTNYCVNNEVFFRLQPTDVPISSYYWIFGDTKTSSADSPSHIFSTTGVFEVSLQVTGENSCVNRAVTNVSIFEQPISSFSLPSDGPACTNQVFEFVNTSTFQEGSHPYWRWYVNSVEISDDKNLSQAMSTVGPHTVRLIAGIPGCESTSENVLGPLTDGPKPDFTLDSICFGEFTSFTNTSTGEIASFAWDFGDNTQSTLTSPKHRYATPGEHEVKLIAFGFSGCNNVKSQVVEIKSPPEVDFDALGPPSTCNGVPTIFDNKSFDPNGSDIKWLWNFNDPHDLRQEHAQHPTHIFEETGSYLISLTATSEFGCTITRTKEVMINESPSADFSHSPACDARPVTFSRSQTDNIVHTYWEIGTSYYYDPSPVHTFKTPGDFPVYLQVIGDNGCIAEKSATIHVPVPLSPDFSVIKNCVDQEATFTDITSGVDPVVARSWSFNPGGLFSGEQAAVTFQQTGNISATLKVTGESGCSYETTRPVVILPAPHANFSASPSTGGYPLEVQFVNTSSDATDYLWSFANETSHEVSPVHTFHEAGEFLVQLTAFNEQRCQHTATNLITTVAPLPDADVELITLSENDDGTYRLIVTIHNKGNTYLRDLPVDIDFGGNLQLREVVEETIAPSSKHNLVFSTDILNPDILEYLCVSMDVYNDINSAGNQRCLRFDDDLYVFSAFPNPASDEVTIKWISQGSNILKISLVDRMGRLLATDLRSSTVGLNQQIINVADMESGIYFLLVDDGRTRHYERILISNNR